MQLFEIKKIKSHIGIIHFIGIGGIGISGIAEIMHHLGYQVQGSDVTENNNTQRLQKLGIKIFYQHEANNILGAEYIVVSSAIKKNNIEILSALEQKIPVLTRAEMLAELMRFKNSIAVSGSHGKTTTTSLIACMIEAAGLAPTVINGGIINNRSTNAYIGPSPYLVAEADESDATFIRIPSSISVITNIDPEHMDYYHSFDNLVHAFKQFILNLPFYGFAIACIDHDMVRNMIKDITTRHIITYGIDHESAHVRAFNIKLGHFHSEYDVIINLPNLYGPIDPLNILKAVKSIPIISILIKKTIKYTLIWKILIINSLLLVFIVCVSLIVFIIKSEKTFVIHNKEIIKIKSFINLYTENFRFNI